MVLASGTAIPPNLMSGTAGCVAFVVISSCCDLEDSNLMRQRSPHSSRRLRLDYKAAVMSFILSCVRMRLQRVVSSANELSRASGDRH